MSMYSSGSETLPDEWDQLATAVTGLIAHPLLGALSFPNSLSNFLQAFRYVTYIKFLSPRLFPLRTQGEKGPKLAI
jgi:hypothetical protein